MKGLWRLIMESYWHFFLQRDEAKGLTLVKYVNSLAVSVVTLSQDPSGHQSRTPRPQGGELPLLVHLTLSFWHLCRSTRACEGRWLRCCSQPTETQLWRGLPRDGCCQLPALRKPAGERRRRAPPAWRTQDRQREDHLCSDLWEGSPS